MTESAVFVRPFDQPRDVRDGAAAETRKLDDSDDRLERGERVGRHLRLRGGEFSQQRGFAGVGETDEAGIRDAAQFQIEHAEFARCAERVLDGRAVGGGAEVPVALARLAALAEHELLAVFSEIGDGLHLDALLAALEIDGFLHGGGVGAIDDGAWRHAADDALAAFAGLASARAVFAVLGDEFRVEVILAEVVGGRVDDEHDIAARAAVAAVRAAARHVFLAPPRDDAVAAVARFGEDSCVIDEHAASLVTPGCGGQRQW